MHKPAFGRANEFLLEYDWFSDSSVPELLEDETVYSWCARFHRLNGGYDPHVTSRVLFGHPKAGLGHDIPGHMGVFQLKTKGALGNSRELLRRRTLFCFHSPFLPIDLEADLLNRLVNGDNIVVRKQLGLERSGLLPVAPLKYCPECVKEQIQSSGVAWWQVSQQLPSSFICKVHGEWLRQSLAKQYRGVFMDFQTPSECSKLYAPEQYNLPSAERALLTSLANWGFQFQNCLEPRFTDATLRHCYLLKANVKGWLNFDGTVRVQKVRDEFITRYGGILQFFGPDFFGDLHGVNAGFLAYMFRQHPSRRHPLKHILLLNFMFDSFEKLLEIEQKVQEVFAAGGEGAMQDLLCEGQTTLLSLVAAGLPVSRAAAEVGISGGVAGKFLSRNGVTERSRRFCIGCWCQTTQ